MTNLAAATTKSIDRRGIRRRNLAGGAADSRDAADPAKEAQGQSVRLASGTTYRGREYARQGLDVDQEDEKAAAGFGMSVQDYRRKLAANLFNAAPVTVDETEETAETT